MLPNHSYKFKKAWAAKYRSPLTKDSLVKGEGCTYTIFIASKPIVPELDKDDYNLVIDENEHFVTFAVKNYYTPTSEPKPKKEPKEKSLPLSNTTSFQKRFRETMGRDPIRTGIWRDLESGATYALYENEYKVRYRQLDRLPNTFFDEEGNKKLEPNIMNRVDTDDYRPDETFEQRLRRNQRDREYDEAHREKRRIWAREAYKRRRTAEGKVVIPRKENKLFEYAERAPEAVKVSRISHEMHFELLRREQELEMKDPITDEELKELEEIRKMLAS